MGVGNAGGKHILVVDDEFSMREFLEVMLSREGYEVTTAENGAAALKYLDKTDYDLLLCDIRLGDMTGLDVLRAAKEKKSEAPVILISAYATTETAVQAMNAGAYDYLPKPFANKELLLTIGNAMTMRTLEEERRAMADTMKKTLRFGRIIGDSPEMQRIFERITQVAATRTSVLISGESGTGKELIARAIHDSSPRAAKAFVVVNCGSIPENLMESAFFGHKRGAFTGASADQKGFFEAADGGTVFLDEISELPLSLQVKLLRALQERKILPVGGTQEIPVDFRIISATNRSLEEAVIMGKFREDLFYRLNVVEIRLPPLRERKEDLRMLAQHFLDKYAKEMGKSVTKLSSYAIDLLQRYDFPGNVRELENLIERSVALSSTNIILPESLSLSFHKRRNIQKEDSFLAEMDALDEVATGVQLDAILEKLEKRYLEKAMELSRGSKQKAADLLGITFRSVRYRLRKYNMD
ncbi:sigma-54 dependent transcriptional regulator [Desulfobotulus sp. H1]|uniref:Sigma-54 dependent transcriptional regulator n=1 Tax=Desulfobotulus pelophilus TaxID=2823377 RepID=A0ABT3N5W7_9BACT|nr:sigma-54 dependent transcriptional regulator [Desulfobotulus pelophilus]MCW7752835.1 sigma-54 dependent transcriptional regulator [Desulfobotulus pelophilus]